MLTIHQHGYFHPLRYYFQEGLYGVKNGAPGVGHIVYEDDVLVAQSLCGHFDVRLVLHGVGGVEIDAREGDLDILWGDGEQFGQQELSEAEAVIVQPSKNDFRLAVVALQDFDGDAAYFLADLAVGKDLHDSGMVTGGVVIGGAG